MCAALSPSRTKFSCGRCRRMGPAGASRRHVVSDSAAGATGAGSAGMCLVRCSTAGVRPPGTTHSCPPVSPHGSRPRARRGHRCVIASCEDRGNAARAQLRRDLDDMRPCRLMSSTRSGCARRESRPGRRPGRAQDRARRHRPRAGAAHLDRDEVVVLEHSTHMPSSGAERSIIASLPVPCAGRRLDARCAASSGTSISHSTPPGVNTRRVRAPSS